MEEEEAWWREHSGDVAPLMLESFELVPLDEVPSPSPSPHACLAAQGQETMPSAKLCIKAASLLARLTGAHHPQCDGVVITVPLMDALTASCGSAMHTAGG